MGRASRVRTRSRTRARGGFARKGARWTAGDLASLDKRRSRGEGEAPFDSSLPASSGPLRIFGIDPGTHRLGYGVIERVDGLWRAVTYGTATGRGPLPDRLRSIAKTLRTMLRRHRPDVVAIEQVFFGKNPKTLVAMGEGRGSALLCCAEAEIPIAEYSPREIKLAVTGHGGSGKPHVQTMVRALLRLREAPTPFDAADALATALCHALRGRLPRSRGR